MRNLIPAIPAVFAGLSQGRSDNCVALTPEVSELLARNAPTCCAVSGGKDSDAMAIAVARHLDAIGHTGPRLLIHADLGRVEWRDSLPNCERLAAHLGWELLVVRRKAGDMLARWHSRWANSVARYEDLSCVKLILPWSSAALRFCTSELKVDVITSALKKRFPNQDIVNASGVRRQESEARRRMPICKQQAKLKRKSCGGVLWNPIIEWPLEDVIETIGSAGLILHEAYRVWGSSRVSCAYCVLASQQDLAAAATCPDNAEIYRLMVELEATSTFAFQETRWLADVAPHLLTETLRERVLLAKEKAAQRNAIESEIPKHLLYKPGWPFAMPTKAEAELIASVRRRVSGLMGFSARHLTAETVLARYGELLDAKGATGSRVSPPRRDARRQQRNGEAAAQKHEHPLGFAADMQSCCA